ncbi:uncharacterized protein PG998_001109 [Apiospora kogelbergensis]|uniref:uncharacterized protein n=1 Tax=Apiospora kogelbergensis TaxID=1337665 RepID=UPI0031325A01
MGDRSQKQPKHDASSNGEEQIEGFQGSSSNGYEELARKTQDLISRRDDLEDTLRLNSKARKKQKRWEKECRKHLKLLDKHLARTDAGHHTIPSKAVRVDAKSLQALLSVAQTYLRDLQRIQESLAAEHGLGSVSGPASAAAPVLTRTKEGVLRSHHSPPEKLSKANGGVFLADPPQEHQERRRPSASPSRHQELLTRDSTGGTHTLHQGLRHHSSSPAMLHVFPRLTTKNLKGSRTMIPGQRVQARNGENGLMPSGLGNPRPPFHLQPCPRLAPKR